MVIAAGQFERISKSIGGIGVKFGVDIHDSQRMKLTDSGEKTSKTC